MYRNDQVPKVNTLAWLCPRWNERWPETNRKYRFMGFELVICQRRMYDKQITGKLL